MTTLRVRFQPGLRPKIEKHGEHDQSSHGSWAHGGLSSKEKEIHQRITNIKRTSWENYDKYAEEDDKRKVQYIRAEYTTKDNKKYILNQENIKEPDDRFNPKVFHSIEVIAYEKVQGGLKEVGRLNTEGGNSGIIEGVIVKPEYQRQGIATAMLNMARTYAPDNFEIEHSFSLTEDAKNWSSIVKHQSGQHDQESHGNWASGNFSEETDYDDALMKYSERYGFKLSDKSFTGTTKDEVSDVLSYNEFGYSAINSFLRGTDLVSPSDAQELKLNDSIKNLDKLIDEAPAIFGNTTLYRVFSDNLMNRLQPGDVFTDKAFLSTTRLDVTQTDNSEAREWLGNLSTTQDTVGIILPNAKKNGKGFAVDMFRTVVDQTSANSDREKEVLLPRNTPLKFIGYQTDVGSEAQVAIFQRLDNE